MKYAFVVFIVLLFNFSGIPVYAEENIAAAATTKAAPFVCEMPAAIPQATAAPDTAVILKEPSACVQDTVLPPCDIIFFKSGKLEYCKIIEAAPTTISYKMCDYPDGPTVIVNKSTVQKIRYANGKEEIVTAEQTQINAYVKARKDPLATLSMIFGLTSAGLVLIIHIVFIPLVLAGIVLGIISLAKIGRRKGELRGRGSAIVGIILCALVLLLLAL